MKKIITLIIGLFLAASPMFAEEKANSEKETADNSRFLAKLGYGIGGTSPLPMPAEIREINGYKPLFNISAQALYNIGLSEKWGILTGLRIERKGMTSDATVKNYGMSINDDEGGIVSGRWTGDVTMTSDLLQLTLPVSASLICSPKWDIHAGLYLSFLLKHKFYGEVSNGYLKKKTQPAPRLR